jgi:DNA polymerase V
MKIEEISNNKSISSSRSFGKEIKSLDLLEEATSEYCFIAAKKLRSQKCKASGIQVYVRTNPFKDNLPQYYNIKTVFFNEKTSNTAKIISAAKKGLKEIYRNGYHYKKCGISLINIESVNEIQEDIFTPSKENKKEDKLLKVIDKINNKMGNKTLFYAAQGIDPEWKTNRNKKTGSYTTSWNELAEVKV